MGSGAEYHQFVIVYGAHFANCGRCAEPWWDRRHVDGAPTDPEEAGE